MEVNESPRVLSGRYELRHLVARGGMAEVYRAHDRLLDRPVALKILFPELSIDRSFVERFRREAQAAANLSNQNIVPVFDWGEDGSTYYIVMEYVDGRPLSAILRGAGPLHPERAAEIAADVAAALSYAHRHGVVHRDVKPGNVLITDEGAVKVTDFGIARAVNTEESLTQTGAVMGTATYFSPEQAEGRLVDARSDVYSLGVVLFEMVTGRPPFVGESPVAVASMHVRETPPTPRQLNPSVPADLESIILTCLAKSPDARYAGADDLRHDLLRFRQGRAVAASADAAAATQAFSAAGATRAVAAYGGTQALPVVTPAYAEEESRAGWWVAALVLLLVALGVVVFFLGKTVGWWHVGSTTAQVTVPALQGDTVGQATTALKAEGLKVSSGGAGRSAVVTSTDPGSGKKVPKGTTVTLRTQSSSSTTSLGSVNVPNVVGDSLPLAESTLTAAHLNYLIQYSTASDCALNVVCSQTPTAGQSTPKNTTVDLFTAQQSTTTTTSGQITIPNVAGDTVGAACSVLGNLGLNCANNTLSQSSDTVSTGDVVTTQPSPGDVEPRGTTITLVVSSGPEVPDVYGDTVSQAESTLTKDGYSPTADSSCASDTDVVTSQSPSAGASEASGTSVTVYCASSSSSGSSSSSSSGSSGTSSSSSPNGPLVRTDRRPRSEAA